MVGKFISLLLLSAASVAIHACDKPEPPEIPDPDTAVTAQMVKAQNDVKDFISKAEAFIQCERRSRLRDDMVAEMEKVADQFNQSIKKYKARMGS